MSIYSGLRMAKEREVGRAYVINCRSRFLTGRLMEINDELGCLADFLERNEGTNHLTFHVTATDAERLIKEKVEVLKEIEAIKRMTTDPKERITDDMIERAKAYPVDRLVEFRNKKAAAWCHEDRHPSLCHMTRKNLAWCPVCNQYFDAIGVLMNRDGYSFIDAVKQLS